MKKIICTCVVTVTALLSACSTTSDDKKYEYETASDYTGIFLRVYDGDTFQALFQKQIVKIRLADIDCFETQENPRLMFQTEIRHISTKQAIKVGKGSKEKLARLLMKSNNLTILPLAKDKYGRIIAYVYSDTKDERINVNQYMLYEGKCDAFPDKSYYKKN